MQTSRRTRAFILLALFARTLYGTTTARADTIDDAYGAGKLFGSGATVLGWGVFGTLGAVRQIAQDEGVNSNNGITLGFGLGQLALGGTLLGVGLSGEPDANNAPAVEAYSAGANVGAGISLIVYGSLLTVGTVFELLNLLDYPEETTGWDWLGLTVGVLLSGFQLGYGIYLYNEGSDSFDTIRTQHPTNTQQMTFQVLSFSF